MSAFRATKRAHLKIESIVLYRCFNVSCRMYTTILYCIEIEKQGTKNSKRQAHQTPVTFDSKKKMTQQYSSTEPQRHADLSQSRLVAGRREWQ